MPLPPNALGEKNLGKIYNDILNFVRNDGDYYPVYTKVECIPIIEASLNFLKLEKASQNIDLKVYSIQYLFNTLKNATCKIGELEPPSSIYITDDYFQKDAFEYQVNIACDVSRNISLLRPGN